MDLVIPLDDSTFAAQSVAYTGTAGNLTGWVGGGKAVLVWSTSDAYVAIGDAAVATTSSTPIPAGVPVLFAVVKNAPGATWRVSAIQISASGTLYAKPIQG